MSRQRHRGKNRYKPLPSQPRLYIGGPIEHVETKLKGKIVDRYGNMPIILWCDGRYTVEDQDKVILVI